MKPFSPTARKTRARRGRARLDSPVAKRIKRLATGGSEFHGNLRRSAGFLEAMLEIFALMGPEFSATSPGTPSPATRRRA